MSFQVSRRQLIQKSGKSQVRNNGVLSPALVATLRRGQRARKGSVVERWQPKAQLSFVRNSVFVGI